MTIIADLRAYSSQLFSTSVGTKHPQGKGTNIPRHQEIPSECPSKGCNTHPIGIHADLQLVKVYFESLQMFYLQANF